MKTFTIFELVDAPRDADLHIRIPKALRAQLLRELAELKRRTPTRVGYADLIVMKLAAPSEPSKKENPDDK